MYRTPVPCGAAASPATIVVIAAIVCGCSTDLNVPRESQLGCKSNEDCPSGWTCNDNVGRCIKTENLDTDAPSLRGEATVQPAVLKKGAVAKVTFEVSEELSRDPAVTVKVAGVDRPLTLDSQPSNGSYVFSYAGAGDEPPETECGITIVLTDKSGNKSGNLSGKSLRFDFLKPSIDKLSVEGSPVKKGGVVKVAFTASEKLARDPAVSFTPTPAPPPAKPEEGRAVRLAQLLNGKEPGVGLTKDPSSRNLDYVYTYAASGDEAEGAEGLAVVVDLEDEAGNGATGLSAGAVVFDFSGPEIKGTPVVTPPVVREGSLVTVAFSTNEELGADPVVKLGAISLQKGSGAGTSFVYTHIAAAADGEGAKPLEISMSDKAGNPSGKSTGQGALFDFTVPVATVTSIDSGPHRSPKSGGEPVEAHVVFETAEPLDPAAGRVRVRVGDKWSAACPSGAATEFDCVFPVPEGLEPGDDLEGVQAVILEVADPAGNAAAQSAGAMTFDFSPPQVSISVEPHGRPIRLGEMVSVNVSADEALDPDSVVLDDGGLDLGDPSVSGSTFTWIYAVKGTDNASFDLSAVAKDLAGNETAAPATVAITLDGIAPQVSQPTVNPPRARGGQALTVTFTASETLVADPVVTCSNGADAPFPLARTGKAGNAYTYSGNAPQSGTVPYYTVAVTLEDPAGNRRSVTAGTLEIDNVAPKLSGLEIGPPGAKVGDTIRAVLTADETLSGPPTLTAKTGATVISFTAVDTAAGKISYSYTHQVTGASVQGAYAVEPLTLTDVAGNVRSGEDPARGFSIDSTVPAIIAGPTFNKTPAYYRSGDTVAVTFSTSENLDSSLPAAALTTGSIIPMPCVPSGGANEYTCTAAAFLSGAETPEGPVGVSMELRDAAGNTGFGTATAVLDFTNPAIISASPSKIAFRSGDTLTYSVSVTEPLGAGGSPVVRIYKGGALQTGFFGAPAGSGTSFTYSATVGGGADGVYTAQVDLTDWAGNSAVNTGAPAGWTVDTAAPGVAPVSVTTNNPNANTLARNGEVVTAVFTVDETPASDPTVTVGGRPVANLQKSGNQYTCTYPAQSGVDSDGYKGVTVTATDSAGNVASANIGGVTFDFTAPSVVTGSVGVQLIPFNGCLLPAVTKVAFGTTARVSFNASEPLLSDPGVTINPSAGSWSIAKYSGTGTSYVYDLKPVTGSPPQGTLSVLATLTDAAGNASAPITLVLPAPGLTVDTVAPTPIGAAQNDKMLYARTPWGSAATGGNKKFTVKCTANGAVEPGGTVVFWDAANTATAGQVGRVATDANGCFSEVELNRADRASVYLTQIDAAGNFDGTTATQLKNVEWTTTLGGKQAGSTIENPTVVTTTAMAAPVVTQFQGINGEPPQTQIDAAATVDGLSITRQAGPRWIKRSGAVVIPTKRDLLSMTYDPVRGRVIVFGGYNDDFKTWEWDAGTGIWIDATPTGLSPPSATGSPMVFDVSRSKAVALLQLGTGTQTWEWDGATWVDRTPAGTAPVKRESPAAAYDAARRVIVFFGGRIGNTDQDDLWEWDCANGAWTQRAKSGTWPAARSGQGMAFDPVRGVTVMYGGGNNDTGTWEWNGSTWVNRTPAGTTPGGRNSISLAYDGSRMRTVLFSGSGSSDTWEFDGAAGTWADRTAGGASPAGRTHYGLSFDSSRGRIILFGGDSGDNMNDTWEWDGTTRTWTDRTNPGGGPSARSSFASAWDSDRKRVILFGGWDGTSKGDTWEYNPATGVWRSVSPAGSPTARTSSAMVYDSVRKKVILFGGYDSTQRQDTWEYDPTAETWIDRAPAAKPGARSGHGMAYDANRQRVVLFGGWPGPGETWEYNGSVTNAWTNRTPASSPPSRSTTALAYDSNRKRVVMFGGFDPVDYYDVWEWDGTPNPGTWTNRTPAGTSPAGRYWHGFAYDAGRRKFYVYGGYGSSVFVGFDDIWELDPLQSPWVWTDRTPVSASPGIRRSHGFQYDSGRGVPVEFLGERAGFGQSDTWDFDTATSDRPAVHWSVPFGAAGAPLNAPVSSVSVVAYAGGRGYSTSDTPAAVTGAYLSAWDSVAGTWTAALNFNSAPPNAPATLSATVNGGALAGLMSGLQQTMSFEIAPVQWNGSYATLGDVALDYMEATVRYKLP